MAYYPDWAASAFPPENIDFKRFDWIDFAFAVPTQTFGLGWDGDDNSADLLRRLVTAAHQNGKRVKLSVGGWTGSKWVSFRFRSLLMQGTDFFVLSVYLLYIGISHLQSRRPKIDRLS